METFAVTHPRPRVDAPATDDSFTEFFSASCQRVVGLVALVTGEVAGAEAATQEAFARAYAAWPRVRRLGRPDAWVVRVASRIAIDGWRRRRREVPLDPARAAAAQDHIARLWVQWGLSGLSPRQRLAVVLRHVDGLSVQEVAEAIGVSPETAKTHLRRGLRRLRARLREDSR
jgi:RNA polymerase sigma-70 factor (ECF subfamily)